MKILIEITPEHYDGLLGTCEESSPEYAILKSGIVAHPEEDGLDRRKVVIWCEVGQAARLLAVAAEWAIRRVSIVAATALAAPCRAAKPSGASR